ncbi:MAG TPA: AAA family ATPase, partial [Rhabdochlamydiaceae bacterium]|nr:AAA family ATPase [Rhabdochlamydiaceae bacterium]
MEEIFGYIDAIIFADEEEGFTIAKLKEPKKNESICILGLMPGLQPGENIHCKGNWKNHPVHGRQFEVKEFELKIPTDLLGIQKYLESGMIKGIGPAYAERIVREFGTETLDVIDEDPEKLLRIPGIGSNRLKKIRECWTDQKEIRSVMVFLRGHGVSPSYARKIYKTYGNDSIEKVKADPFALAQEIKGIGFKSADRIAKNLGIAPDSPQRIDAGIEHILWETSNDGNVCYPIETLIPLVKEGLQVADASILLRLPELIQAGKIIQDENLVFVKPLYLAEVGIARELSRLMESACFLRSVDKEKAVQWTQEKFRIQFAEEQKKAIQRGVSEKMLIITGGPGTGKSTITKAILAICEKLTKSILLAAPTGRAAKRMSEICHKKAFTIHSLLEMDFKTGRFKKDRNNPLQCDLIVIDESSMIDTFLMHSLLKAIPSQARVIFVGDIDQLPSVGPGNVLRDMIDSMSVPVCVLKEIFRQAKGSQIVVNSHR